MSTGESKKKLEWKLKTDLDTFMLFDKLVLENQVFYKLWLDKISKTENEFAW